ncbi:MAG: hypothetical protein KDA37_18395, partial [Planctomycetales bacterium]|nr:hypothetical protein [Planctomycetales bacterium]
QVVYQSATYSCLLWLQIPTELEDQGIFALRDPLFAVQERIGSPGYAVVVPKELRMFTFPGFLERFSKPASRDLRWSRPLVWLNIDVCYY